MSVVLPSPTPACFDLHVIGDPSWLDPEQAVQGEFRYQRVSRPMDVFPAIDRARRYRHIDRNLRGQLRMGTTREPNFRRTERSAQKPLLQINGPYCLGEKEIDGYPRIRLSKEPG